MQWKHTNSEGEKERSDNSLFERQMHQQMHVYIVHIYTMLYHWSLYIYDGARLYTIYNYKINMWR